MARKVLPKCVRAARAFDGGTHIEVIAQEFGWTERSAEVNVARGRHWEDFIRKNTKGNRERRRRAEIERRRQAIPEEFLALVAEAQRLGVELPSLKKAQESIHGR